MENMKGIYVGYKEGADIKLLSRQAISNKKNNCIKIGTAGRGEAFRVRLLDLKDIEEKVVG